MNSKMIVAIYGMCSVLQLSVSAADDRKSVDPKDRQSEGSRSEVRTRQAKWHAPMRRIEKSHDESIVVVMRHVRLPWDPFAPGD